MSAVAELERITEAVTPGDSAKVVKALRKDQDKLARSLTPKLEVAFKDLGKRVSRAAAAEGGLVLEAHPGFTPDLGDVTDMSGWVNLTEADVSTEARKVINAILKKENLKLWSKEKLQPVVGRYWGLLGEANEKTLAGFNIEGPGMKTLKNRLIREGGKRMGLVDITEDTKRSLFHLVNDAMKKGWGPDKVARAIEIYVPRGRFINAGSRYRSYMIARTEMVQASGQAALNRYEKSGLVTKVLAFDGDGDDHCIARNGNTYTIEQARAELNGTHPNCVLTFGPDV